MEKNKSIAPPFAALYIIFQTVLVTLKLTGDLEWSWWLVPLPTYIYVGMGLFGMIWMGLWVHWIMKHADPESIKEAQKRGAFMDFVKTLNGEDTDEDEDEDEDE